MKIIRQENVRTGVEECDKENGGEKNKERTEVQDILVETQQPRVRSGLTIVVPGLALCGAGAVSYAALEALGVSCVVSAAPELPDTPLPAPNTLFVRVPVRDSVNEDIASHFHLVADIIEQVRVSDGCTLVHCVAGVSRSAALCLAYLMKHQHFTLRDAFHYLREKRPQIRPNTGFFRQLIKFEEELYNKTTVKIVFNEAADKDIPDVYEPDYSAMLLYRQTYYCRY